MLGIRERTKRRRRRLSPAQLARAIGSGLRRAYRRARAGLWRFKRSPARQDRAAAIATFTFIGLLALGSVDAVITGGADFGPTAAYAEEYAPARLAVVQPVATVVEPPPAIEAVPETIDYSFTAETLLGGPLVIGDEKPLALDIAEPAKTLP